MNVEKAWKVLLVWYVIVMVIFLIAREWSVAAFGITYGLVFGGVAYRYRHRVRPIFSRAGLDNYTGFLMLSLIITVTEETYCYLLGNNIAHPVLWVDLVLVTVLWSVWFGTWYFYLSRRYVFSEKEALMTAGAAGVLYEYVGTGVFLKNPIEAVIAIPLALVIYAAIFVLPMQLIDFTGTNNSWKKYPVGVILPFILTIPAAVIVFLLFMLAGYPLD